jgi:VanZ family protein
MFAFVVLGLLLRLGFRLSYFQRLALLIGYGACIEASQYFTPTRSADWADIGADTIGAFLGLKLYQYLQRLLW